MISKQKKSGKLVKKFIAVSLIIQAIIIGVKGNIDVLSGKNPIDVIQSMIAQGVELIIKAYNAEKRIGKKIDRTNKPSE
ncbi:hypothetical protein IQ264_30540 [Phormidium sp. LEGE 05292]|uniref:hypothetical protein n=1 Tax=[Phormidium] sp. LEGE 05292 TaxID=767427 RepID=UPI00187EB4E9|nr:hypothetical protein [Phormidium sp. LEGE 05292]MBE9229745.1 hypothetical protein [Phormidium sp. LEGE 05292]